jgi:excisionase family DNA binding protein
MEGRLSLTVIEAAKVLGISRTHAYAMAQSVELPTVWLGKRRLVPVEALKARLSLPSVTFDTDSNKGNQ